MANRTFIEIPFKGIIRVEAPRDLTKHAEAIQQAQSTKGIMEEWADSMDVIDMEFGDGTYKTRRVTEEAA